MKPYRERHDGEMRHWPALIRESVQSRLGPEPEIKPLGGMSGAAVVRLEGCGRSAVLKRSRSPIESYVYHTLSGPLRAAAVGLPELYASFDDNGTFWLLLENIPHAFPRQRWEADEEQLAMLRRLHELDPDAMGPPPDTYQPAWTQAMSDGALSLFDPEVAASLTEPLGAARQATTWLLAPDCLISGDPTPANWGLRDDATLVLYDWERCTLETPAIDLAITVPGLGTMDVFQKVAAVYSRSTREPDPTRLASDIAHAKIWVVVEFLAGYAQGLTVPTFSIESLLEQIPNWLNDAGVLPS